MDFSSMSSKLRRKKPVCTLILGRTLGPACDFARAAILSTWPLSCTVKKNMILLKAIHPGCCFSCRNKCMWKGGFNPEKLQHTKVAEKVSIAETPKQREGSHVQGMHCCSKLAGRNSKSTENLIKPRNKHTHARTSMIPAKTSHPRWS